MPPAPEEIRDSCDALYIHECQQCGISVSDLHYLTIEQVEYVLAVRQFVDDAVAYAEEDEGARRGEAAFFG